MAKGAVEEVTFCALLIMGYIRFVTYRYTCCVLNSIDPKVDVTSSIKLIDNKDFWGLPIKQFASVI
jgi:hypothetical protein